jgi:hypothetical protein
MPFLLPVSSSSIFKPIWFKLLRGKFLVLAEGLKVLATGIYNNSLTFFYKFGANNVFFIDFDSTLFRPFFYLFFYNIV